MLSGSGRAAACTRTDRRPGLAEVGAAKEARHDAAAAAIAARKLMGEGASIRKAECAWEAAAGVWKPSWLACCPSSSASLERPGLQADRHALASIGRFSAGPPLASSLNSSTPWLQQSLAAPAWRPAPRSSSAGPQQQPRPLAVPPPPPPGRAACAAAPAAADARRCASWRPRRQTRQQTPPRRRPLRAASGRRSPRCLACRCPTARPATAG